jgi:hypothetical protein
MSTLSVELAIENVDEVMVEGLVVLMKGIDGGDPSLLGSDADAVTCGWKSQMVPSGTETALGMWNALSAISAGSQPRNVTRQNRRLKIEKALYQVLFYSY